MYGVALSAVVRFVRVLCLGLSLGGRLDLGAVWIFYRRLSFGGREGLSFDGFFCNFGIWFCGEKSRRFGCLGKLSLGIGAGVFLVN